MNNKQLEILNGITFLGLSHEQAIEAMDIWGKAIMKWHIEQDNLKYPLTEEIYETIINNNYQQFLNDTK